MNIHTSRACNAAQRDYLTFVESSRHNDLASWVSNMQSRGLADNTVRQRVYLVRKWLGSNENIALPTRRNVREPKWLNLEQVQAMLAVIPNNERGRRDFAMITAFLLTGRRLGQVSSWRWIDFQQGYRNQTTKNLSFPKAVLDALQAIRSGCTDAHSSTMPLSFTAQDEDYIFASSHCQLQRYKNQNSILKKQPLSPQEINRRIRRYARLAGLEPQGITTEALRHTQSELDKNTLITLVEKILNHRNASPVRWKHIERDGQLHGIGRRGHRI